jgi:hypothetical protein
VLRHVSGGVFAILRRRRSRRRRGLGLFAARGGGLLVRQRVQQRAQQHNNNQENGCGVCQENHALLKRAARLSLPQRPRRCAQRRRVGRLAAAAHTGQRHGAGRARRE